MSISHSAAVLESMAKLSGVSTGSRDKKIDIGTTRRKRDMNDCQKFYNWFEIRNPFNMKDGNLYTLSTGIVSVHGKDKVNCEEAEEIGGRVQESLNDIKFSETKIKRIDAALDSITRSIGNEKKFGRCFGFPNDKYW